MSKATLTIRLNSSYVLIGTTSDRLGTGAARPPAPRVNILHYQCLCLSEKDKIYKNESAASPIGADQRRNTGFLSL